MHAWSRCSGLDWIHAEAATMPFRRIAPPRPFPPGAPHARCPPPPGPRPRRHARRHRRHRRRPRERPRRQRSKGGGGNPGRAESAIPDKLLDEAKGIVVVPDTIKAGFMLGGRRGLGLMAVKSADGTWSNPVFVKLAGASFG